MRSGIPISKNFANAPPLCANTLTLRRNHFTRETESTRVLFSNIHIPPLRIPPTLQTNLDCDREDGYVYHKFYHFAFLTNSFKTTDTTTSTQPRMAQLAQPTVADSLPASHRVVQPREKYVHDPGQLRSFALTLDKQGGYGKDTVRPMTIKQILDAQQSHPDADFRCDGEPFSQVCRSPAQDPL